MEGCRNKRAQLDRLSACLHLNISLVHISFSALVSSSPCRCKSQLLSIINHQSLLTDFYRHLLGKKSWNVYNADNIAKVKHDEALAAAREADEEQRMQEVDAEHRIQILRGLQVPAPALRDEPAREERGGDHDGARRDRKRRRIAGEDDTERDIRLAQENSAAVPAKHEAARTARPSSNAPLTDGQGHINLFPVDGPSSKQGPKNAEAEAEAAKKKREYEDQYTMRFSNAAGFKQAVGQTPWYHSLDTPESGEAAGASAETSKNVWGNEDPRRKERAKTRLGAEDPLAAMQQGVQQLREVEKERQRWRAEQRREIEEMADLERRGRARKQPFSLQPEDPAALDDFSLDAPAATSDQHHPQRRKRGRERSRRHHHHHRRHHHPPRDGKRSMGEADGREENDLNEFPAEPRSRSRSRSRSRNRAIERARAPALMTARSSRMEDSKPGWERSAGGRYSRQFAAT